jgi:hypothetical protein
MATVTFDTMELVGKRKSAGFPPDQAEAVVRVIAEAQQDLVTREYFDHVLARDFAKELGPIRTELAVLKWMMGVLIGGVIALVVKAFFA